MNNKTKDMLATALILLSIVFFLFMAGKDKHKLPKNKPSQYDSVFKMRIDNIKKIDSIKPVLFEQKYHYQKKARSKATSAKANAALYDKSIKDGDTSIALQHIDSAIAQFKEAEKLADTATSFSDSIIGKQAAQIAAYEGLLTMTRTELSKTNKLVINLQTENAELKEKLKRRKKRGAILTGIIISGSYLLLK